MCKCNYLCCKYPNVSKLHCHIQGNGFLRLPAPAEFEKRFSNFAAMSEKSSPRLYKLLTQPGAVNMIAKFFQQLSTRFAARSVKFLAGSQDLAGTGEKSQ